MDPKELRGLVEAYQQIYAPQEEIEEAVKGESSERRKDLAAERRAGIKPLSAKEGERYASHKMAQMAYAKRKRMGEEVEEVDEATNDPIDVDFKMQRLPNNKTPKPTPQDAAAIADALKLRARARDKASKKIDEAVKGADPEMRRAASAERRAGDKRLSPSKGKGYAAHAMQQAAYVDKKTKGKYIPGMTHEEVEQVDESDSLAAMQARREKRLAAQRKREGTTAAGKDFGHNYWKTAAQRKADKDTEYKAGMKKEGVDIFDTVLEYLVAEGYADNNQEALYIMANLSEEEILEYRKLAAGLVGGMMALNMMKPGIPSPEVKRPVQEPDQVELVKQRDAATEKKDKEERERMTKEYQRRGGDATAKKYGITSDNAEYMNQYHRGR